MTTPPLPMTSSWLFKMPKLEKKKPSQCQEGDFQNFEDIISSSKCYQHIRKFLKNDAPTLPRAFSWLMKNAQNLEKNTRLVPRGCLSKLWTHRSWFFCIFVGPILAIVYHNMWFFKTSYHPDHKAIISVGIVLAS